MAVSPFYYAIRLNDITKIRLLLTYGADKNKLPNNVVLSKGIQDLCEEYEVDIKEPVST